MAGVNAFGTVWQVNYSGSLVTVADVTSIGVLDVSSETIETTAHSSAGGWREFINGLKDGGELSMEVNYDPTVHAQLYGLVGGVAKPMRIICTDAGAGQFDFNALVTGFSADAPFDDKLSASVTIKVTGAITFTP